MNVLLVEDNPTVQEYIQQAVSGLPGARIVEVIDNEPQASRWLAENPDAWDLALIDVFLKQGHGFGVLRSCRLRAKHQRAVLFSNYSRGPVAERAHEAGADAFFDKSLDLDQLVKYLAHEAKAG